jgi:hypothetical protein
MPFHFSKRIHSRANPKSKERFLSVSAEGNPEAGGGAKSERKI